MGLKALISFVALAFFIQSAVGQCLNAGNIGLGNFGNGGNFGFANYGNGLNLGFNGLGSNIGLLQSATVGGDVLEVASGSANTPNGVSLLSQNEIAGGLAVSGALPFASSVGFGGVLSNIGEASVSYSSAPGGSLSAGYGLGLNNGVGLNNGFLGSGLNGYNGLSLAGIGCGCGF